MNITGSFNTGRLRAGLALLLSIFICCVALRLGSIFTVPHLNPWYAGLSKPWFNPPDWAFPVAWTALFILMALALWRVVIAQGGWIAGNRSLIPFGVQLVLNVLWSYAFFGNESPAAGLAVILLLIPAIGWTMAAFRRVDTVAAWLLAPYLLWVCYAAALNLSLWRLNA